MNRALFRKELRHLSPLLALVLVVLGVDGIYEPLTGRPDEFSWSGRLDGDLLPGRGSNHAVVLLALALMAAYSLFPREHEEGTIEFLHSLPVSRGCIFRTKLAAAWLVLCAGVLLEQVVAWALQLPNPQPFSGGQFRLATAAGVTLLYSAYCGIILCHGVLLSFFRKFGLIVLALAAWAQIAAENFLPSVSFLNVMKLLALEYEGKRLVLPWGNLAIHGAAALAALGLAWLLWNEPAERFSRAYLLAPSHPVGKVVLGCGTAALVALGFAFFLYASWRSAQRERGDVRYVSFLTARAETRHYQFVYPANLRERALGLVARADRAYEDVRASLGAREDAPIVADLTERSAEHAGIAAWQKIRMDIAEEDDGTRLLATLVHETVHAFQLRESERRMADNARATHFWGEGLAQYVSFRLVPEAQQARASRRLAVAACRRHRLEFEELADQGRLHARLDENLVYPVGETWAAALVEAYGDAAPGKVLRAMGRPGAPRGLAPLPFWQDTLSAAGYDLERVTAVWKSLLARVEGEERAFLDLLPRIAGGPVGVDGDQVLLIARLDRAALVPAGSYFVRVRNDEGDGATDTQTYEGDEVVGRNGRRIEFRVPRASLRGRRFEFQFGVEFAKRALPYFEAWQAGMVPR